MRLITYRIGEQLYGLPLLLVGEFYPSVQATRFDARDSRIHGITHIRGGSAVVLDLRCVAGNLHGVGGEAGGQLGDLNGCDMIYVHAHEQLCEEARLQKLRAFDEPTVLVVDRLSNIQDVDRNDIHQPPAHMTAAFYEGVFETDAGDLILMNYEKLIHSILADVRE